MPDTSIGPVAGLTSGDIDAARRHGIHVQPVATCVLNGHVCEERPASGGSPNVTRLPVAVRVCDARGWMLGRVDDIKVVHTADCRHARRPYTWASNQGDLTEAELADRIISDGPWAFWANAGCRACCPDLAARLSAARATCMNPYQQAEHQ